MKNKIFNFVKIIFIAILSIALSLGGWALGYFFFKGTSFAVFSFSLTFAVIIILSVLNNFAFKKFVKSLNIEELDKGLNSSKDNLSKTENSNDDENTKKERAEQNYKKAEKCAYKSINQTFAYVFLVFCLFLLLAFSSGATNWNISFMIIPLLICFFAFYNIIEILLSLKGNKTELPPKILLLKEDDFKEVYSVFNDVFKKTNFKGKAYIYLSDNGISIDKIHNKIIANVNPVVLKLLSKDEFYAVVLREIEGLKSNFTKTENKIGLASHFITESLFTTLFFSSFFSKTIIDAEKYKRLSLKRIQCAKDSLLTEKNLKQNYINAMAKSILYGLFGETAWKETSYTAYESETPKENYMHLFYNTFIEKMKIYGERWNFTLKNKIPLSSETGLSFPERMKLAGIENYDAEIKTYDGKWGEEQEKLLSYGDKITQETLLNQKEQYTMMRNLSYVERKKAIEKYSEVGGTWLSDEELIECAQAYNGIDDEKSLEILNEVIERTHNPLAMYTKGLILAREYDDGCIELFKETAKDPSATETALSEILKYAMQTGNQKVLDEYKNSALQQKIDALDALSDAEFNKNDAMPTEQKDQMMLSKLVEDIKSFWSVGLNRISVVKKITESGLTVFYISLDISKKQLKKLKISPEKVASAIENTEFLMSRMSDAHVKHFVYFKNVYSSSHDKTGEEIESIKGSCIWKNLEEK